MPACFCWGASNTGAGAHKERDANNTLIAQVDPKVEVGEVFEREDGEEEEEEEEAVDELLVLVELEGPHPLNSREKLPLNSGS